MKKMPTWIAAVAVSTAAWAAAPVFGQARGPDTVANAQRSQDQDNKRTPEERRAAREAQQANKAERREQKREREQLNNMPEKARKVLRAETANAKDVDYFRIKDDGKDQPVFGATYTSADGKNMDLRVDRQGTVISRTDLTAQATAQAAAQQPATPAPVPAPTPAPAPAPTPAPTSPTASADQEAPKAGDPIYRRMTAQELPENIRVALEREAHGSSDARYYRTKYRGKMAYEVKFTDGKGIERGVYVNDNAEVVNRRVDEPREGEAVQAGAKETASPGGAANPQAAGRVEMNALPKQAQTQLQRLTEGGKEIKLYRTRYGKQDAYQAKFQSRDGKNMSVYVDENGKVLSQKEEGK